MFINLPVDVQKQHNMLENLFKFPPDSLPALLLGSPNDLMKILKAKYSIIMSQFCKKHGLEKSEGIGGSYAGPSIQIILSKLVQQIFHHSPGECS